MKNCSFNLVNLDDSTELIYKLLSFNLQQQVCPFAIASNVNNKPNPSKILQLKFTLNITEDTCFVTSIL